MESESELGLLLLFFNLKILEKIIKEGDNPVKLKKIIFMNKTINVKSCLKIKGPPLKPNYFLIFDSEQVLRRKGEKEPQRE